MSDHQSRAVGACGVDLLVDGVGGVAGARKNEPALAAPARREGRLDVARRIVGDPFQPCAVGVHGVDLTVAAVALAREGYLAPIGREGRIGVVRRVVGEPFYIPRGRWPRAV